MNFGKIEDEYNTIKYILDNKVSISRYGDGEFTIVNGGCKSF